MTGRHVNDQQVRLYMRLRTDHMQITAAAKSGFSVATARRIDRDPRAPSAKKQRQIYRTRSDPLAGVWDEDRPAAAGRPGSAPDQPGRRTGAPPSRGIGPSFRRTLERCVAEWKALHGADQDVMFREIQRPGRMGLSDFTDVSDPASSSVTSASNIGCIISRWPFRLRACRDRARRRELPGPGERPVNALETLLGGLREVCAGLPDRRRAPGIGGYPMADIGLSAFALFFMGSPSFLAHQRALEEGHGRSNCQTLFGISAIPTDSYIRLMLDGAPTVAFDPLFYQAIETEGVLAPFQRLGGRVLIALDGTEHFCSRKIHCQRCSTRKRSDGGTEYFHAFLGATIVAPGHQQVLPLPPEFIAPRDGAEKQDCERNAAKRRLERAFPDRECASPRCGGTIGRASAALLATT